MKEEILSGRNAEGMVETGVVVVLLTAGFVVTTISCAVGAYGRLVNPEYYAYLNLVG